MLDSSGIGIFAAFMAGVVSFLSPCVLPLVPGFVSYIVGGVTVSDNPLKADRRALAVMLSFVFVLGFTTVFVILGASATTLGRILLSYRYELNIVGGAVIILFGLFMLGIARINVLQRDTRFHLPIPGGKPVSAYALGLAFGFGWSPCIGPILGAILMTSAVTTTVKEGIALLVVYSLGLGIPFLCTAAFAGELGSKLNKFGRLGRWLQKVTGLIMVLMGIAIITGKLTAFSYWLLSTFPFLGQIG